MFMGMRRKAAMPRKRHLRVNPDQTVNQSTGGIAPDYSPGTTRCEQWNDDWPAPRGSIGGSVPCRLFQDDAFEILTVGAVAESIGENNEFAFRYPTLAKRYFFRRGYPEALACFDSPDEFRRLQ